MAKSKKIVMTGGGTAGHVTQTLPLCRHFRKPVMKLHISVPTTEWKKNLSKHKNPLYRNFFRKTSPLF